MSVSRELKRQVRRYEACLPRPANQAPAGPGWIHEIKHDGFRILAELDGGRVRLITRKGFDLAQRFPLAAAAIAALPARSCIVDSEAIACDANGLSIFDLLRYRRQDDAVTLCAFDLLELDGVDLRPEPIEVRKRTLEGPLRRQQRGIAFNRHFDGEGAIIYKHACALGASDASRGEGRLGLMPDRRFPPPWTINVTSGFLFRRRSSVGARSDRSHARRRATFPHFHLMTSPWCRAGC